jgi:ribonucleoside-triphosphate reductase
MTLEEHLTKSQYRQLLRVAAKEGCNYFTFNIPNTICNTCGHIDKRYLHECPKCHSTDIDYATRIIGYMKRVSSFSQARQKEAARRYYANGTRPESIELPQQPVAAKQPVEQEA